jgi:hypothetical protein
MKFAGSSVESLLLNFRNKFREPNGRSPPAATRGSRGDADIYVRFREMSRFTRMTVMGAKSSKSGRKLPVRSEAHVTPMLPLR